MHNLSLPPFRHEVGFAILEKGLQVLRSLDQEVAISFFLVFNFFLSEYEMKGKNSCFGVCVQQQPHPHPPQPHFPFASDDYVNRKVT
jgi:hypothetical protein